MYAIFISLFLLVNFPAGCFCFSQIFKTNPWESQKFCIWENNQYDDNWCWIPPGMLFLIFNNFNCSMLTYWVISHDLWEPRSSYYNTYGAFSAPFSWFWKLWLYDYPSINIHMTQFLTCNGAPFLRLISPPLILPSKVLDPTWLFVTAANLPVTSYSVVSSISHRYCHDSSLSGAWGGFYCWCFNASSFVPYTGKP